MTAFVLCAMVASGSVQCIPFAAMSDCEAALAALHRPIVVAADCGEHVLETAAPRYAPIPKRRAK